MQSASAVLLSTLLAAAAASVSAADIVISTGVHDAFNPTSIKANAGDNLIFNFHENLEHNLISSLGLSTPCEAAPGGIATALQPNGANVTVPVNGTDPAYFFCSPHCKSKGMVFILNPASDSDVAAYAAAAKASNPDGTAASSSSASSAAPSSSAASSSSAAPASSSAQSTPASSSSSSAPAAASTTSKPDSAAGLQSGVAKGAALLLAGVAACMTLL